MLAGSKSPYYLELSTKLLSWALLSYVFLAITTFHHVHPILANLPIENLLVLVTLALGVAVFILSNKEQQKNYLPYLLLSLPLILTPLLSSLMNRDFLNIFFDAEYRTMFKMLLVSPMLYFAMNSKESSKRIAQYIVIFFCLLGGYFLFRYLILHEVRAFDARPLLNIRHGDPNFLATFFVMITPIALYLSALFYKVRAKYLCLFFSSCSLFLVFCILMTQSRMAILALFISLGFLIYKKRHFVSKRILMIFALLIGAFFVFNSSTWQRFQNITDKSNVDRVSTFKNGLMVFLEAPLWGAGMHKAQESYYDNAGYPHFQNLESGLDIHNSFLKSLADLGLMGLIAYGLLFLMPLKALMELRTNPESSYLWASFIGLVICLMAIGVTYKDLIIFFLLFLTFLCSSLRSREIL